MAFGEAAKSRKGAVLGRSDSLPGIYPEAEAHGMLRIADEFGEDYLFPSGLFVPIHPPVIAGSPAITAGRLAVVAGSPAVTAG